MLLKIWSLFILGIVAGLVESKAGLPLKGCAGVVCPRRFEKCEVGEDLKPVCVRRCPSCDEIINKAQVCGTDGKSYQSVCHVREVECMTGTVVDVACDGLCPCDPEEVVKMDPGLVHKLEKLRLKVRREKRLDEELARETASVEAWKELNDNNQKAMKEEEKKAAEKKEEMTPEEKMQKWQQLKAALKKEEEKAKERVLEEQMMQRRTSTLQDEGKTCQLSDLQQLPGRLVDWFHVLKSSELRRLMKESNKGEKSVLKELRFVDSKLRSLYVKLTCKKNVTTPDEIFCLEPVRWMFDYLDENRDKKLSHDELSVVDDIDAEHCVRPFFMDCDTNKDGFLEQGEFCKCLCVEPPCTRMMEDVPTILVKGIPQPAPGFFVPKCDEDGFFMPLQCHSSKCWCVDRNGATFKGTTKFISSPKEAPNCGIDNTDTETMPKGETEYFDIKKENSEKMAEP